MNLRKAREQQYSLRRTLITVFDIVLIGLAVLISASLIIFTFRTEQQTWASRRLDAAVNAANTVNNFVDHVYGYLSMIGRIDPESLASNPSQLGNFLTQEPALLEIVRVDAQGNLIANMDQGEPILSNSGDIPQSDWYSTAKAGQPYYGRFEFSKDNHPYMLLAAPSTDGGIVAARLDLNRLRDIVGKISFGESGQVYLVDRETGKIIAHPDREISLSRTTVQDLPQESSQSSEDSVWQGAYLNLHGDRVLGSALLIPEKNWTVFAEVPVTEAYANTRRDAFYLVILFIAFSVILAYVSNRYLNQILFKPLDELRRGAEKIAMGELDDKIGPQTYIEFSELGTAFNDMAGKLGRRETALKDALNQAMVANIFKGQLLAHVSHDLRTPINAIMGFSELLKEEMDGPLNEAQKLNSERIYANSRRLLSLVNSLLDQAQLERGTFQLNYSNFAPRKFAEAIGLATESLAKTKGLAFSIDVDKGCPDTIRADFERAQQIAMNLIDNAIKFTDSGMIQVRIFSPEKGYWAFSVTDTGPGIALEHQSIIFQAFRQLDELATRKHGGVGLGLSIVQHLTQAMMGKVWVESEIGKGSVFTVLLPYDPDKEKP